MKKVCKMCGEKRLILKGFCCRQCKTEKKPSYWKTRAWDKCSLFNRQKDTDQFTGYVKCVTCPKTQHWKLMQGGHFLAGRGNGILFDDRGIHAQCYWCNGIGKGQQYIYGIFMLNRYGQKVIDELQEQKDSTVQYTIADFKRIADEYDEKLKTLDRTS